MHFSFITTNARPSAQETIPGETECISFKFIVTTSLPQEEEEVDEGEEGNLYNASFHKICIHQPTNQPLYIE